MGSMTAHATWGLIAIVVAASASVMRAQGLSLDWSTAALPALASGGIVCLAAFYRHWRPDERLAAALTGTAQLIAFSASAEALSYAVASFGAPLQDGTLAALDRALGLDWLAYLRFVGSHPWLAAAFGVAYNSILAQLVVATVGLGLTGQVAASRLFLAAVVGSGTAIIAISGILPATAMSIHLGLAAKDYPALDMAAVYTSLVPFEALRNGTLRMISLTGAEGIVTFPSYHAALGVILAHAFWHLRWLRWPGLVLNLTMIASTPLNGGHYFVDVVAGMVVALGALAAARAFDGAAAARRGPIARPLAPMADPFSI